MDGHNNGASHIPGDDLPSWDEPGENGWYDEPEGAEETLGRELAAFAVVREEDDREVRLYFRDAHAAEIAGAFRRAGAIFISMTGERARLAQAFATTPESRGSAVEEMPPLGRRRRKRKTDSVPPDAPPRSMGEAVVRYFYATESIVYTIIITTSTGILDSIGSIYPSARLSEGELQVRLSVIFR